MCGALALCAATATAQDGLLHTPSPDWRDQIIYFVVTDRFEDGNPANNDQGSGEFDPTKRSRFSGGDLAGVTKRLDYIQGLGATAVWVTPFVENQWLDAQADYGGYHGYWASNFKAVDAHFGALDDVRNLSRALHSRGMYFVQDIVLNHTANFFGYDQTYSPGDPTKGWSANATSAPMKAPTQAPFNLNDPRRAADRAAGIYHWTPNIADIGNREQELNWQLSGLDDLNTENPAVRAALRDSYSYWIKEAGVDAFRVDTIFYVPPDLMKDFIYSTDPKAPGALAAAKATGRQNFFIFGEGFGIDRAGEDKQMRKIESYATGGDGSPITPGMLNFPLYGTMLDVFARGKPTQDLAQRIEQTLAIHARPHLMPTFIDNHDVDRFLATGNEAGLKQALLMMMTLPGVPVLYYGTEQGFTDQRASMFAKGWGSKGRDWFDTQSPLYRYVARATALRKENAAFRRGAPSLVHANANGPGPIAYSMQYGDETLIVALNTAPHESLLTFLLPKLSSGAALEPLFAIDGTAPALAASASGQVDAALPARSGYVWRLKPSASKAPTPSAAVELQTPAFSAEANTLSVSGTAKALKRLLLVINGDLSRATAVRVRRDGRWSATVVADDLVSSDNLHSLTAWDPVTKRSYATTTFRVAPQWRLAADQPDPAGDDFGPLGMRYRYPTDPTYAPRTMDLRRVRAFTAGGALKVEIEMAAISQVWNPQNGFDHVAFTLFVEAPGQAKTRVMPQQNASLPAGMGWSTRIRAHGWSNALFRAQGASETTEGTAGARAATVTTDLAKRTVTFTIPASALGAPKSLTGAKIYINTWDYDGGYRALTSEGGAYAMGGGDGAKNPKIMDEIGPILLK
jgi:glycosidase